jgi:hypothetical protein
MSEPYESARNTDYLLDICPYCSVVLCRWHLYVALAPWVTLLNAFPVSADSQGLSSQPESSATFYDSCGSQVSVKGYSLCVVHNLSILCFIVCYRPSPRVVRCVAFRFYSVNLTVLSQGNLSGRSLQGPRSATTGWLTNTTLSSGLLSLLIGRSSLSDYSS